MSEYYPYLCSFTIWTFVPRNSQKCVSGAYDIQNVLVLVNMGSRLIAVNMHHTKFILWTPKLQILTVPKNQRALEGDPRLPKKAANLAPGVL